MFSFSWVWSKYMIAFIFLDIIFCSVVLLAVCTFTFCSKTWHSFVLRYSRTVDVNNNKIHMIAKYSVVFS